MWASGARSPDAPGEHRFDEGDCLRLHARCALGEAAELQRHHEARHCDGSGLADPRGVREHDVALKLGEIGGLNPHACQLAEAGIDSIDRIAARQNPPDRGGARSDSGTMGRVDRNGVAAPYLAPVDKRRLARSESDGHCPLQTRACSGLKPSR
jgi:hypothetical protein